MYAVEAFNLTRKFISRTYTKVSLATDSPAEIFNYIFMNLFRSKTVEITALENVNLKIEEGEFFGLLGPNGAGKTTLLQTLACLLMPTEGTATVMGHDIVKEPDRVIEHISFITGTLTGGAWIRDDALTARENIRYAAEIFDVPKSRADEALELVGLGEWMDTRVGIFSTGMRARLILAIGLLKEATVYLMDEPMVGLSIDVVKDLRDYLKNHINKKLGTTIVYATNHLDEAQLMCDRVAIMSKGKVMAIDSPVNLIKRLGRMEVIEVEASSITSAFARSLEKLKDVANVSVSIEQPEVGKGFIRIHTPDTRGALPDVVNTMVKHSVKVHFIKIVEPTLEDVIIHLSRRGT